MKTTLLTGLKPTGTLHLGNYFGVIKPFLDLRQTLDLDIRIQESFIFVANYHALTTMRNSQELRQSSLEIVLDYLALGLDPEQNTIFYQSDVPELTELTWIFDNLVTVSYLERSHAYKDAVANGKEATIGLFNYPVLMASDILMYDSTIVPVGQDQKQHVEIAREIAKKFNKNYKELFVLPKPIIQEDVSVIKGLDGRKMSKSYNNTINIFEEEDSLRKKIMSIVTDSKRPEEPKDPDSCNIMALQILVMNQNDLMDLEKRYREGTISYKESKELLFENLKSYFQDYKSKRKELQKNLDYVHQVLKLGGQKAQRVAQQKMEQVRECVGLGYKL